ncbi:MAG: RNA polymerase sigma factor [Armatimonadota bacterium]
MLGASRRRAIQPSADRTAPATLASLYDLHSAGLYRYLLALLGSEADAEDALHDVFAKLARHDLGRIRDTQAYLFAAARRQGIQVLRDRGRRRDHEPEVSWLDLPAADPEDLALALDLDRALRRLPPEQREVICLHVAEGLSFREISAACRIPLNTAASRYRLAIARLRALLEGGD